MGGIEQHLAPTSRQSSYLFHGMRKMGFTDGDELGLQVQRNIASHQDRL
jgi:hypothetical protein